MPEYLDRIEIEQDGQRHELCIPQPVPPPTADETERELMRRYLNGLLGNMKATEMVTKMKEFFPGSSLRDCVQTDVYRVAYRDSETSPTPMVLYADGLAGANAIGWNDTDRRYTRKLDKTVCIAELDLYGIRETQGLFSKDVGSARFPNLCYLSVRLHNQNATAADLSYLASSSKNLNEVKLTLGGPIGLQSAFCNCPKLLRFSCDKIGSLPSLNAYNMFAGCKNLSYVDMYGIRLTNVYGMFRDTAIVSGALDFIEIERPGDAFPGTHRLWEMRIRRLGTPAACTNINFSRISLWNRAALLDTLNDTHDRVKAGYAACTLTLHRELSPLVPENMRASLSQKGYTLVFR